MPLRKSTLEPAPCAVDLGDGSERGENDLSDIENPYTELTEPPQLRIRYDPTKKDPHA
ncbi:MAG: hypothetical protein KAU94_09565 [Verrucomicrobia bacterium]|nr:hypothetical protein [Verrucomicrobiota bacterium]